MRQEHKLIILLLIVINQTVDGSKLWSWRCVNTLCQRYPKTESSNEIVYPSVESCRLACGPAAGLWPQPTGAVTISSELIQFSANSVFFTPNTNTFVQENVKLFQELISQNNATLNCAEQKKVQINILATSSEDVFHWTTDESYKLNVITLTDNLVNISISANTIWGARHGLETLSQLIELYQNDNSQCLVIPSKVTIKDAPVFPHRGLLLDTARNFMTIETIKNHINGLAASKMNILHWHVTDSQSFPLEISNLPNMTKFGAYSNHQIYSKQDVEELISYARLRGVRVIIEIDAPAHAGNGWQWGPAAGLGDLAVCVNRAPYRSYCIQPPCGQLNPINPNLYMVLEDLYRSIVEYLPQGEIFHMGGDEVSIDCWNSTPAIVDYLKNTSLSKSDFYDLWAVFQRKALNAFDNAVGNQQTPIMLWTSDLTDINSINKYLSKERYVIQTWVETDDPLPTQLINLGYKIIVSTKNAWYLDHGVWGTTVYHDWQVIYNNQLPMSELTLGGEVCMWSERIDSSGVEVRTWPRAAAAAERLWSNPKDKASKAWQRFARHRQRLVDRGLNAEALFPQWCYQNEGSC